MQPVRLVLFDCDGTLVDSQRLIVDCILEAFSAVALPVPEEQRAREIIGLSLPLAMARLAGTADNPTIERLVQAYLEVFHGKRETGDFDEPMFDGALAAIDDLRSRGIDLGVVTGKSRRGLDAVLSHHGLARHFITTHTGDVHPSKPHPAMVHAAMLDAGAEAAETVIIGDTVYDIDMAKAAGCRSIGVSWGYHSVTELERSGADHIIDHFSELTAKVT